MRIMIMFIVIIANWYCCMGLAVTVRTAKNELHTAREIFLVRFFPRLPFSSSTLDFFVRYPGEIIKQTILKSKLHQRMKIFIIPQNQKKVDNAVSVH